MIEVFKTTVTNKHHADILVVALQKFFPGYTVNFDLEDCDRILRVKSTSGPVDPDDIIYFLRGFDFHAEVLPDDALMDGSNKFTMMMRCIMQN